MKKIFLLVFPAVHFLTAGAQEKVPFFGKIQWISGYAHEISGENISYTSAYPDYATVALLTRCTDGRKSIEWETALIPNNAPGKYVYFSWVAAHSSGTSGGERNFDLYVNGEKLLAFTTFPKNRQPNWTYGVADSSRIVFQQLRRDGADDAHGRVFLRLPLAKYPKGKPLRLRVTGEARHSSDWYMTFKFSFEERIDAATMPFILRSAKNNRQPLAITVLHFGSPQQLRVSINGESTRRFTVVSGLNHFELPVDTVAKPDSLLLEAAIGKLLKLRRKIVVKPVVYRSIYFIHHSHTDIGYSHLQPQVVAIHNKNITSALMQIERTKNLPPDARFKWNIESAWAAENFLKQASPGERAQFIKAVKEGSICISGLYANILTGLSEPEEVFHYTDFARKLEKDYGISINSAMISDVPGYAWTTVTGLAHGGIRYLSSGPNYVANNPYTGDRVGFFNKYRGDRPVWWVSPSGEEKILFWTAGRGYSSWHGTPVGGLFEKGPNKIAGYMNELAEENYPYDMVQWRYNVVADNGPVDTTVSAFVDEWNKKYASPRIVLSTTDKLFEKFEKRYGNEIPEVRGDFTPYWEDGALSTASEEGMNRRNSLRLQQLATWYAMLSPSRYDANAFYEAWRNILLFHEHTWGAYNSISEPDAPFVTEQWRIKKQFMLDADRLTNSLEKRLLVPFSDSLSDRIAVCNTLSWERSGPVYFRSPLKARVVVDAAGNRLSLQLLGDGSYVFLAKAVPAFGTVHYQLVKEEVPASPSLFIITDSSVANNVISLVWDRQTGSVKKLQYAGTNVAGDARGQGLNSYWYGEGRDPAAIRTNQHARVSITENGPVLLTVSIASDAPGVNSLERKITLFAGSAEVDIKNIVDKKAVREKEALYFGFSFNRALDETYMDAGYGTLLYGCNQLPGSNRDYGYGRRWLDVHNQFAGVQWLFKETPLVVPGGVMDERLGSAGVKQWREKGEAGVNSWYSYAMNNFWHTNYKADQQGMTVFEYALFPHGQYRYSEAEQNGMAYTQPLVAMPVKDTVLPQPLLSLTNNRVVVTSITPFEKGYRLRLFNPEPSEEQTNVQWMGIKPGKIMESLSGRELNSRNPLTLNAMAVMELTVYE
jgi:hypothetical protein